MPDIKQSRFVAIVVNLITRALTRVPRASSVLLVLALTLFAGACSSSPVVYRDAHVGIISTPESIHTDKQIAFDLDIDLAVTTLRWTVAIVSQIDHCWESSGTSTRWVANLSEVLVTGQDPEDVACRELGSRLRAQAEE